MATRFETARRQLLERRAAILATQARVDTELKGLEDEVEKEVLDKGQEETVARVLSHLDARARSEILEIDAAIGRMDAGVYGSCEVCGAAIHAARLAALPTTRLCLACAEKREGGGYPAPGGAGGTGGAP